MNKLVFCLFCLMLISCSSDLPELLVGKWRVTSFDHSLSQFDNAQRNELEKRAKSTTYDFKNDFQVRVTAGYNKSSKMGTWYWDEERRKLVINDHSILAQNTDTIFIHKITQNKMVWVQKFNPTDTSFINLKRVN